MVASVFRVWPILAGVLPPLLLLACAVPPDSSDPQKPWRDWEASLPSARVPIAVFPAAAMVRAYGGRTGITVAADGTVGDGAEAAEGGEALTAAELAVLRRSFFLVPPPPAVAACCIPRHAFVFFDAAGHYLGNVRVCFQCGCALFDPALPAVEGRTWVAWDEAAIRRILETHHLPVGRPAGEGNG